MTFPSEPNGEVDNAAAPDAFVAEVAEFLADESSYTTALAEIEPDEDEGVA